MVWSGLVIATPTFEAGSKSGDHDGAEEGRAGGLGALRSGVGHGERRSSADSEIGQVAQRQRSRRRPND